jgi:F-type H+-transporting ATPase subunit c
MLKRVLAVAAIMTILATPALAEATAQSSQDALKQSADQGPRKYLGVALALGLGLAAFGGAFGQGRAISAAVDAVARQPEAGGRIQGMMIIGLALIETLVIYMLLICFVYGARLDPAV